MSSILEHSHDGSALSVTIEDEEHSWWAYLVDLKTNAIVADVWVRNRISAPERDALEQYRGGPPPAVQGFDGGGPFQDEVDAAGFDVRWSPSGEAVHVVLGKLGEVAMARSRRSGFSRCLARSGPWGQKWDDAEVSGLMQEQA